MGTNPPQPTDYKNFYFIKNLKSSYILYWWIRATVWEAIILEAYYIDNHTNSTVQVLVKSQCNIN